MNKSALLKTTWYITIIIILIICLIMTIPYSRDYGAYEEAYGHKARFEPGYTYISLLFNKFTQFKIFWLALLIIQACLIAFIYRQKKAIIFLPISFIYVCDNLYGSQIRWGIATLLFILYIQKSSKVNALIAPSFHYSILALFTIKVFAKITNSSIYLALTIIASYLFIDITINYVAQNTIYSYYLNSNFFEPRSLLSTLYSITIIISSKLLKKETQNNELSLIEFLGNVNAMSFIFYNYAIISGRLIDSVIILEPFLLYALLKSKTILTTIIFFIMLIMLTTRLMIKFGVGA